MTSKVPVPKLAPKAEPSQTDGADTLEQSYDARTGQSGAMHLDAFDLEVLVKLSAPMALSVPPGALKRLHAELVPELAVELELGARVERDAVGSQTRTLGLSVSAQMQFQCRHCLKPLQEEVSVSREFLLVDSEEQAAAIDDELSEMDVIAVARFLRLTRLVEDELLMATPLAPKHLSCDAASQAELPSRPNPFAALAALKKSN
jgi:uncharacterized protein